MSGAHQSGYKIWTGISEREHETRNKPALLVETFQYGSGECIICATTGSGRHTDLQDIRHGRLTSVRYRYDILRPNIVPIAEEIGSVLLSWNIILFLN